MTAASGRARPATSSPMTAATATITPRWDSTPTGFRRSVLREDMASRVRDRRDLGPRAADGTRSADASGSVGRPDLRAVRLNVVVASCGPIRSFRVFLDIVKFFTVVDAERLGRPAGRWVLLSMGQRPMWNEDWSSKALCNETRPDVLFVRGAAQNRAKQMCAGMPGEGRVPRGGPRQPDRVGRLGRDDRARATGPAAPSPERHLVASPARGGHGRPRRSHDAADGARSSSPPER